MNEKAKPTPTYKLEKLLHSSQRSLVYEAMHLRLRRRVVLKYFRSVDTESMLRLQREAEALSKLRHPANIQILDLGQALKDGKRTPYLVLEHIEGQTFRQLLQEHRRLGLARTRLLVLQVLMGLAEAHELGIVHRDVKPENLMVYRPGGFAERAKVIDYGIAQPLDAPAITRMSSDGVQKVGTPQYMAPELANGGRPTAAADIYALGVVLYECVTGRRPYESEDPVALLYQHIHHELTPVSSLVPIPKDFEDLIHRCLAKDPNERPKSARVLFEELAAIEDLPLMELDAAMEDAPGHGQVLDTLDVTIELPPTTDAVRLPTPVNVRVESTRTPSIWLLGDDPALQRSEVREAIASLASECDVREITREQSEELVQDLQTGKVPPPWVVLFGGMHVILADPLLSAIRPSGEISRLLLSTHLNEEMLDEAINFCGLDGHLHLPVAPAEIVVHVERMLKCSKYRLLHYDSLRLAVRDAREDVNRLSQKLSQYESAQTPTATD